MTDENKKPHAGGRGASDAVGSGERRSESIACSDAARSMPLTILLDRLDGVQRSGKGCRARCPGCNSKDRRLAVSEKDTGALLIHCFGGCAVAGVLAAVGLSTADLFPKGLPDNSPEARKVRRQMYRAEFLGSAIEVLAFEAEIVLAAARHQRAGVPLTREDEARLASAVARISDARMTLRG